MKSTKPKQLVRTDAGRRGSLLLEVIVAAAMLGTLLLIINQSVVRLHKLSAALDRHRVAQQALENLLEEITSRGWTELDSDTIASLSVPELASRKLPQVAIEGEIEQQDEPVATKRITLRIKWLTDTAVNRSLQLTTWVYPQPEVEQ